MTHTGSRYNTVPKSAQKKSDTVQNTSEVTHVHTNKQDRLYVTAGDWNAAGLEPGTLSSEPEPTNDVALFRRGTAARARNALATSRRGALHSELRHGPGTGTDEERSRDQPTNH